MSEVFDVHIVQLNLGAFSGSTHIPLAKVPNGAGGITILEAYVGEHGGTAVAGAGTIIGGQLVKLTNVGTPAIAGTIGALEGTVVFAQGVVSEVTLSTPFVDADYWIGLDAASGTCPPGAYISIAYVMGK